MDGWINILSSEINHYMNRTVYLAVRKTCEHRVTLRRTFRLIETKQKKAVVSC